MDDNQLLELSKNQLDRVLNFFPRVELNISVVLGVNLGMLALLATNAPPIKYFEGYMTFPILTTVFIGLSLWHISQGLFPRLDGGSQSLIYFREIANRTESKFISEFRSQKEDELINDILGQVWRNSEILKKKYDHLKYAFIMLALAIIPWLISLALFASKNTDAKNLLVK
jgi:hypothetical protein